MGVSFLHMADVHLDTPFQNRDAGLRNLLRESIRQAFKSGVDLAISKQVDALLIAGDAFDDDTLSFSTERFLLNQFKRLEEKNIRVFYAPGNHDPYGSSFRLGQINWPSNVYTFKSTNPETVPIYNEKGEIKAVIVGAGHEGKKEGRDIASKFPQADGSVPYIGLLHTLVCGASGDGDHERYAPCTLSDLENKGYKYWALGHVHTRMEISKNPYIVYPGNIVGRNSRETGAKGAYLVEINNLGVVETSFVGLAPLTWMVFNINCLSDIVNMDELVRCIRNVIYKKLDEEKCSKKILARIILEGACPLYKELQLEDNIKALTEEIFESTNFEYVEIRADGVQRQVEPNQYRNQIHVLGKALELIDNMGTCDELLMKLKPDILAGCEMDLNEDVIDYLRGLLKGLDYEAAARMVRGDDGEN